MIYLCGSNGFSQLGEESNNNSTKSYPIIYPPFKSHLDPSTLLSLSAYSNHSIWITRDNRAYAAGSKCGKESGLLHFAPSENCTEILLYDLEGNQCKFISAVCGLNYTLFIVSIPEDNNSKHLVYLSPRYNAGAPFFIYANGQTPKYLFGSHKNAAAIDSNGGIYVFTYDSYSQPNVKPSYLPDGERAKSVSFCSNTVLILSINGRLFESPIPSPGEPLTISEVSELVAVNVVCVSGTFQHALAVTDDGRVYARGAAKSGALGLGEEVVETDQFTLVESLLGQVVKTAYAGHNHSLFLRDDGCVLACGDNSYGQLALEGGPRDDPVFVPVETTVKDGATFCIAGNSITGVFVGCEMPPNMPNCGAMQEDAEDAAEEEEKKEEEEAENYLNNGEEDEFNDNNDNDNDIEDEEEEEEEEADTDSEEEIREMLANHYLAILKRNLDRKALQLKELAKKKEEKAEEEDIGYEEERDESDDDEKEEEEEAKKVNDQTAKNEDLIEEEESEDQHESKDDKPRKRVHFTFDEPENQNQNQNKDQMDAKMRSSPAPQFTASSRGVSINKPPSNRPQTAQTDFHVDFSEPPMIVKTNFADVMAAHAPPSLLYEAPLSSLGDLRTARVLLDGRPHLLVAKGFRDASDQVSLIKAFFVQSGFEHGAIMPPVRLSVSPRKEVEAFYPFPIGGRLSDQIGLANDLNVQDSSLTATQKSIIAFGLADALRYMHSNGYVFGEVNPMNVYLDSKFHPYLTNFYNTQKVEIERENVFKVEVLSYSFLYAALIEPLEFQPPVTSPGEIGKLLKLRKRPLCRSATQKQMEVLNMMWDDIPRDRIDFAEVVRNFENGNLIFEGTDLNEFNEYSQYLKEFRKAENINSIQKKVDDDDDDDYWD